MCHKLTLSFLSCMTHKTLIISRVQDGKLRFAKKQIKIKNDKNFYSTHRTTRHTG